MSGLAYRTHAAFAVSITLPPPTAIIVSAPESSIALAALLATETLGSGSASFHTVTCQPLLSRIFFILSG